MAVPQANKSVRAFLAGKPRGVIAVAPDDSVLQALRVMAEKDIGAVLVMRGDALLGILSERDYARKVDLEGKTAASTLVRDIMTDEIVFAAPTDTIVRCMALMKQRRIRHLPVIEGNRAIGVLSARDVLEEVIAEEEAVLKDLQHERVFYAGNTGGSY